MPSIEITPQQARALARGEDITVFATPMPPRTYIVVFDTGNAFKVKTPPGEELPPLGRSSNIHLRGQCTLIAKGPHHADLGHVQSSCGGAGYVVPVPS